MIQNRFVNGETEILRSGSAPRAGAISVENFARSTIQNCTFTNYGAELGTIMTNGGAILYIEDSTFTSNVAASGGAIHVDGTYGQSATVRWSAFSANQARC